MKSLLIACIVLQIALTCRGAEGPAAPLSVRVAIIGGMNETGFWEAISERFEKASGIRVETVATGPKEGISAVFRNGGVDLITMHASDNIINLVADGLVQDPQPWARNDLIIVGPPDDPAGIKGMTNAAESFKKIAAAKAAFVVHSSLGAQEVMRNIIEPAEITLPPESTTVLFDDKQRRVLKIAAEKKAYTMVGRIPFRSGRIPNDGLVVMVAGDVRLRRPYVLAVANPAKVKDTRFAEAKKLAEFLRSSQTQAWIATFGKGKFDDQPLFFPVDVLSATP